MKTEIMAIFLFIVAFIITTAGLIYFNNQYKNIFKFDFTPVGNLSQANKADSTAAVPDSVKALDSLKNLASNLAATGDSVKTGNNIENNSTQGGSPAGDETPSNQSAVKNSASAVKTAEGENGKTDLKSSDIAKMDQATYQNWKKNTAKIIEGMTAEKASQILRMYADNIGGDLLYSMKKKKAAEILSKFDAKKDSLIIRKLTRIK